jgi:transposase
VQPGRKSSSAPSSTSAPSSSRIHKDAGKNVFLILDNLRVHRSKIVKAWMAERQALIELFYLPSYSPELNPEERLNADFKQEVVKRVLERTKANTPRRQRTYGNARRNA